MKKYLTLLLLALSVMSSYAYDVYIDGIYYNLVPKAKRASVTFGDSKYGGEIVIPESITSEGVEYLVTNIEEQAFSNSSLTSIYIPNTITNIGNNAFSNSSLISIIIPESVTNIGRFAFGSCSILSSIEIPNSVTSIGDGAFSGCQRLTTIRIPNSVTNIGKYIFLGCSALTTVEIPNTITRIGEQFFENCRSLTSIVLPNSLTDIDVSAFRGCSSLTSIVIPNLVTSIGEKAFYGCENLTDITIGSSVSWITSTAFTNCPNLENVYCYAISIPYAGSDAFEGSYIEYANLYVPAESIDAYKSANVWKDFGNIRSLSDVIFAETINVIATNNILGVGETEMLTANVLPSNTTNKSVTWSSSNSDIVSVNTETGEVTAVAYGSAVITATSKDGSNVTGSITITVKAEQYDLVDGEDYQNEHEFPCDELTYTRNFTNTNWNALYVPFAMQYTDWEDNFEIARLNDVHQFDDDEDGEIDRTVLEVVKMKEGSTTEPNVPYMIKAKEAGEKTITLTDVTLYATEENNFDVTSWFTKFTFTGTYSTVTDMATKGHYALANGGLMQASSDAATLGAFRWYLDITDRNGNPAPLNVKKVFLSFDDGEETAIDLVEANVDTKAGSIYSISGVKVGVGKSSLSKGLYISNGKKFLVK